MFPITDNEVGTLLAGLAVTIQVTVFGGLLGMVVAPIAGVGRLTKFKPARLVASAYVELFRGTSALVQLFFAFFALPLMGVTLSPLIAAVLVLGLNAGAYGAEIVRGAVQAVPHAQVEASIAVGLGRWTRMRRIIFPQALLAMLPPGASWMIDLLKNTALVSVVALADLAFEGEALRREGAASPAVIYGILVIVYFVLAQGIALGFRLLERRLVKGRVDLSRMNNAALLTGAR